MERPRLASLEGRTFDVTVVGGGIVGASAAQHLTSAGYRVLLVDKGDFGAGSSSRSGRMLTCGLRYLEPGEGVSYMSSARWPVWRFLSKPRMFASGCRRAREAMNCRSEIVNTMPERVRAKTWIFPIYADGNYRPWHINAAAKLLWTLGPKDVPLDGRMYSPRKASPLPFVKWLRDPEKLSGVFSFREYRFEWPERICLDTVLDAERMGATVRNYTLAAALRREADGDWSVTLQDSAGEAGAVKVRTHLVLNTAGIWIDRVNRLANPRAQRKITGTKGTHLMVKLPDECRVHGIFSEYRDGNPFYIYPWRGMHYVGPTDTLFEGDEDEVRATREEVDFLLEEANHLLPGLGLRRSDICFTWAGVRPQTNDPNLRMGARGRVIHDLASDGMPGVLALTAGNIITHRLSGRDLCAAVKQRLAPSMKPTPLSYAAKLHSRDESSPALLNHWPDVRMSDLRYAAKHESPVVLADLLFRRVGAGWTETMAREGAQAAAEEVADIMGWDASRIRREVGEYHALLSRLHGVPE
jgi:glycerol-3-phosphate dehydrogenase